MIPLKILFCLLKGLVGVRLKLYHIVTEKIAPCKMNRYSSKNRRLPRQINSHSEEDNREDQFLEMKTLMDFIVDLGSIVKETND